MTKPALYLPTFAFSFWRKWRNLSRRDFLLLK